MGFCAIQTPNGQNYLTAVNGGGMGAKTDVPIRTNSVTVGTNERFRLVLADLENERFALLTAGGYFVTFVNAGGMGGPNTEKCPLHTDATEIRKWELFTLIPQTDGWFAIQTPNGKNFLSAVEGGGWVDPGNRSPIHTDSRKSSSWEIATVIQQA